MTSNIPPQVDAIPNALRKALGQSVYSDTEVVQMVGARSRKMPATFSDFLTSTEPDNEWLFSLRGLARRPVDFPGMIVGGEAPEAGDELVWLTLGGWVGHMRVALEREAHAKLAASRLHALDARVTTPGKPKGRG